MKATSKGPSESELRTLTAPVAALIAAQAPPVEVGRALIDLRGRVDGRWAPALRLIWPQMKDREAWAREAMDAARKAAQADLRSSQPGAAVPHTMLARKDERRYRLLRPLIGLRGHDRKAELERIAKAEGVSLGTAYRWLRSVEKTGAAALRHKRRSDAGASSICEEARQMLVARRLNPRLRKERLALSIRIVCDSFPEASEAALRHIARQIPKAARMSKEEYAKRFLPTGEWRAPYPNHSWSFDYTIADVKCWDGDPRVKPYRPWVTGVVDECTGSPMAVLYTRDHPDRHALRSVLLMAILPKGGTWPQHGLPERLHGDNGKIQRSIWLADVCRQIGIGLDLQLELAFSNAYESWQNGHIESFWKDLHQMYEARFAEVGAYCGRSPEEKPEGYIGDSPRGRHWEELPNIADLNRGAQAWLRGEYLTRIHSRLGMSRNEAWALAAAGHINIPDEAWLRQILMFKERRKIARARVQLNGITYWHERLIDYDGLELPVWWDAADLERVLMFDAQGHKICWALAERPKEIGDTASLAEYRRKRATAMQHRRQLLSAADEAMEHLPAATIRDVIGKLEDAAEAVEATATSRATELSAPAEKVRPADEGIDLLQRYANRLAAPPPDEPDLLPLIARGARGGAPGGGALTFHGIDLAEKGPQEEDTSEEDEHESE